MGDDVLFYLCGPFEAEHLTEVLKLTPNPPVFVPYLCVPRNEAKVFDCPFIIASHFSYQLSSFESQKPHPLGLSNESNESIISNSAHVPFSKRKLTSRE